MITRLTAIISILAWLALFVTPIAYAQLGQIPVWPPNQTPSTAACSSNCYYVSNSGSDSNNCSTTALACQTIAHINGLTLASGATVLFNGGQTFTTTTGIDPTLGGNATFTSYGTGNATISSSTAAFCFNFANPPGSLTFTNLICAGGGNSTTPHNGIGISNSAATVLTAGITISGMTISGYGFDCVIIGGNSTGNSGFNNISITNNIVHDCGGDAATNPAETGNGINVMNGGNTSTYLSFSNVTITGNTVYNTTGSTISGGGLSGVGINVWSATTVSIANNVVYNGGSGGYAPGGIVTTLVNGATVQFNEVYGWTTADYDGLGIDFDAATENSVMQYNYVHDNAGEGFAILNELGYGTSSGNTIRFNVGQNNGGGTTNTTPSGEIVFGTTSGNTISTCAIYNNTLFNSNGSNSVSYPTTGGTLSCTLTNNIFYTDGDIVNFATLSGVTLTFNGNDYWGPFGESFSWGGTTYTTLSSWGQDSTNGKTVNPRLNAAGMGNINGGYLPTILGQQYELQAISTLVSAGQTISSPGSQDYFGNAVTSTTLPVGAGKSASATITLTGVGTSGFATPNLTTDTSVPAGALFVVVMQAASANTTITTPTVTGCTMTQAVQNTTTSSLFNTAIFSCVPASGIAAGATVGNGSQYAVMAYYATGVSALDKTNSLVHATGVTSFSLATAALSSANELVLGMSAGTTGYSTFTDSSGFHEIASGAFGSVQIVTSTTAVTWAPSLTPSQTLTAVIATFH